MKNSINYNDISLPKAVGFTLAEVLITLMIIGVVAALTIPGFLYKQDALNKYKQFKRVYAEFGQTVNLMMTDNGGDLVDLFTWDSSSNDEAVFRRYFDVEKYCGYNVNTTDKCWHGVNKWSYYSGGLYSTGWIPGPALVLKSGEMMFFSYGNSDCQYSGTNVLGNSYKEVCFTATIDINGFQKPNTYGKDIFVLDVDINKILPEGAPGSRSYGYSCAFSGGWPGTSCAYNALLDIPQANVNTGQPDW